MNSAFGRWSASDARMNAAEVVPAQAHLAYRFPISLRTHFVESDSVISSQKTQRAQPGRHSHAALSLYKQQKSTHPNTETLPSPAPLRCDAEDTPQPVVELEGRLRAVEVISRHTTWTTGAVHRNNVHVICRAVTLLGSLPL